MQTELNADSKGNLKEQVNKTKQEKKYKDSVWLTVNEITHYVSYVLVISKSIWHRNSNIWEVR